MSLSTLQLAEETRWLVELPHAQKLLFLSRLGHQLTIAGRNSYRPQTEELDKPAQLCSINEVLHRVLACLIQLQTGTAPPGFDASIVPLLLEQQEVELSGLMRWAWDGARAEK